MSTTARHPVISGPWHRPETWGGILPQDSEDVHIPPGFVVTCADVVSARLNMIMVEGELRLLGGAELFVDTIMVHASGKFFAVWREGRKNISVTFIDNGPIPVNEHAPLRGLISEGYLNIRGQLKTPFVRALAFDTQNVFLSDLAPADWQIGDQIIIPGNRFRRNEAFYTVARTIQNIDGASITLDQPIDPTQHQINSTSVQQIVANVTRRIVFRSENPATDRRGHVRIHHEAKQSVVRGAAFIDLGRTDKARLITDDFGDNPVGIYPLHMHHTGSERSDWPPHGISHNVVIGSPGWGIVLHGSRATIDDNVVYGVTGAGIVAEDGNERGRIKGNACINMYGTGTYERDRTYLGTPRLELGDFAHEGVGIWSQAPLVYVMENVAACCHGPGLFHHDLGIAARGLPVALRREAVEGEHGADVPPLRYWDFDEGDIVPVEVALIHSQENTAIACFIGFKSRFVQNTNKTMYEPNNLFERIFRPYGWSKMNYLRFYPSFKSWNCETGAMVSYTTGAQMTIYAGSDNPVSEYLPGSNPTNTATWIGIQCNRQNAQDISFNGTVEGYPIGAVARYPGWPSLNVAFNGCTENVVIFDPRADD